MRMPSLHGNIRKIHTTNCEFLFVPPGSIDDLPDLIELTFENIRELVFQEFSFNSSRERKSIKLEIINSTVPSFPSHFIKGHLEDLLIRDSNINKIHTFAFTGFFSEINAIKIINSVFGEIETQAFKKITIREFTVLDTTFQATLVSKTFYDCHIMNFIMQNSQLRLLHTSTFDLKEVQRLRIENSTFGVIEGEAFMMDVSDRAIFSNNKVTALNHGAFRGEFRPNFLEIIKFKAQTFRHYKEFANADDRRSF